MNRNNRQAGRMAFILLALFFFMACKDEAPSGYTGKDALYFDVINSKREVYRTFFLLPQTQTQDTVRIRANTMGNLAGHDRPVAIRQINAEHPGAAQPGVHYIALDDPSMQDKLVVPADSSFVYIPLVLLRHPDMEKTEFKLEMEIVGNEHFEAIPADAYTKFTVIITAVAVKPARWDEVWLSFFGNWGSVKMKFIMEVTGYKEWDQSVSDVQYKSYLVNKCKTALHSYNAEHPSQPLREADGTVVLFP